MKIKKSTKVICFIILAIICICWIFPVVWAILTSFKSDMEIQSSSFSLLPKEWTLDNYRELLDDNPSAPVLRWFLNSLVAAGGQTLLVVVVVSLASYGYSRLKFKGRDAIFNFLLMTMMFPTVLNLIPNFKIVDALGWTNTFLAIIVPGAAGVYNIFLVRQFVLGIPVELDESAVIDGANEFQIFRYIILPLIRPALTVVVLFTFTGAWNDFLWPTIVMSDVEMMPITPGLQLLQGQYLTYPGIATAGALLALVPTFILYMFAQKYFMESMALSSGIK